MRSTSRNGGHATTVRTKLPVTTRLLVRRARELERHLPQAVAGDDTGVHQARVASRRLREAVPVVARGVKRSKKAQRKIRRVTQALGTVREMDVTMKILDELAHMPRIPRNALEDVRGHVLEERDRRREMMLVRLKDVNTDKLNRRLAQVARALESDESDWRGALAARINVRAKRLVAAIHTAGQIYVPERLHEVRIATKKLRYGLELAADARVPGARRLVNVLKRSQETLGRLNDLNVIQRHVAQVQAHPHAHRASNDRALNAIAAWLEEECRHLHGRYTKQIAGLLALCEQARTSVLNQLTNARAARKPLKMRPASTRPAARRA
jgi:CHAD domain-containing protein